MDLGFWPALAAKSALLDHFESLHPAENCAVDFGGRTSLAVAHRSREVFHCLTTDSLHRGLVRKDLPEVVVLVEAVDDLVAYYGKTSCCAIDRLHVLK